MSIVTMTSSQHYSSSDDLGSASTGSSHLAYKRGTILKVNRSSQDLKIKDGYLSSPSSSPSKPEYAAKDNINSNKISNSNSNSSSCNEGVSNKEAYFYQPKINFSDVVKIYKYLLLEFPWFTNTIQSAVINMISVITSQKIKSAAKGLTTFQINWLDVFLMMFISASYSTPLLLKFYRHMKDWRLGGDIGKLLFSQFVFFPLFNLGFITYRFFLLRNKNIGHSVLATWPSAQTWSWSFWIPQTFIAIKFVPHDYHILFGSFCAFFWNIIFAIVLASSGGGGNSSH